MDLRQREVAEREADAGAQSPLDALDLPKGHGEAAPSAEEVVGPEPA